MTWAAVSAAVAWKDLRIEVRARHAASVVAPFAVTQLIAFGLSLGPGRSLLQAVAPGLLWLSVLFSAVLAFRASFEAEGEDGALERLRLALVDRSAIFAGKAAAVTAQLIALELLLLALSGALFGGLFASPWLPLAALVLGTAGLACLGTLFGVLVEAGGAREALFPMLLLPLATPVLIAGVRATASVQDGHIGESLSWLALIGAFDVVFATVGALLFGQLLDE